MSMALIVQTESNTANGGSLIGQQTGSDTTSAADTFNGRRLTDMLINESAAGVPTVNTFTASTGGGGSSSTEGTFVLVPGTYRISIRATYYVTANPAAVTFGLYNVTSAAFEVYSGTAIPVLGTTLYNASSGSPGTMMGILEAIIAVTSTNKTFALRHKANSTGVARAITLCGSPTTMTGANVNGAAATNTYCEIKILKTA